MGLAHQRLKCVNVPKRGIAMSLRRDVKTGPIEQWQMYKTTLIAAREALLKVALKKGPIYDDIRQDWTYVRPAGISPRWSYRHPEKTFSMSDAAGRRANIYHALDESGSTRPASSPLQGREAAGQVRIRSYGPTRLREATPQDLKVSSLILPRLRIRFSYATCTIRVPPQRSCRPPRLEKRLLQSPSADRCQFLK